MEEIYKKASLLLMRGDVRKSLIASICRDATKLFMVFRYTILSGQMMRKNAVTLLQHWLRLCMPKEDRQQSAFESTW